MAAGRYLIVNADDFGQSPGVNRGVAEARECGIVTSASLMVRWPAAAAAAEYARAHPGLSVGLHLDLGEWAHRGGEWVCLYRVVPDGDAAAAAREAARQLAAFRDLTGRDPTHLDSHQHVHREPAVLAAVRPLADALGVPLRHCGPVRYCGDFYGQTGKGESCPESVGPEALIAILKALPAGITELACHPALGDDLDSMYRTERGLEVQTLCDPRVRAALADEGIELCSFHRPLPG
ncbi:MAG TPA: ChbG/HpnK family deacetylase [Gemmataceae bacterium]|jgi:predicted glycoside hydrolase/deacetylase ChbG (UPF0249 family)